MHIYACTHTHTHARAPATKENDFWRRTDRTHPFTTTSRPSQEGAVAASSSLCALMRGGAGRACVLKGLRLTAPAPPPAVAVVVVVSAVLPACSGPGLRSEASECSGAAIPMHVPAFAPVFAIATTPACVWRHWAGAPTTSLRCKPNLNMDAMLMCSRLGKVILWQARNSEYSAFTVS